MNAPSELSNNPHAQTAASWLRDHGDMMFAYALRRLSNADDAEDAVQDALIAAMKNVGTFQGVSTERTWLVGILRHKVLDLIRLRAKARLAQSLDDAHIDRQFVDGYWANRQSSWQELPDSDLQRQELRAILERAIDDLPPTMRTAFCLREIDQLDAKEICKVMNITPTNLWTLIHRARLQLRRSLTVDWFEKGDG